jgi:LysR family transcriptional regulator, regulator for bpeEF and oprC
MDKLRALHYFVASADAGSFAGAARTLGLSVPAVQRLVVALEENLGAQLFERRAQGVALTGVGANYLEACRPLLDELASADLAAGRSREQVRGTLTVAAHPQIARHVFMPALPRFLAAHPEVQVDLRIVHRLSDEDAAAADVFLLHGWPEALDLVVRPLGLARSWIVASPSYWAAHGQPAVPAELASHDCLLLRNPAGILLDLWEFERGGESASVSVGGRLCTNDREILLDAALSGAGVARFNQLTSREFLRSGQLVPVLTEWDVKGGPPLNLAYRPTARRMPRTRLLIEFVLELAAELERDALNVSRWAQPALPHWHRRGFSKASSALRAPDGERESGIA